MATLRLFASIREIAGTNSLEVDANNVSDVITEACSQFGDEFVALVPSCRIWVNGNPAELTDSVTAQDEIALLPPVSGGSLNHDSLDAPYAGLHIAILSLHTSPLAQPGTGDSGGMNVYIREVASALAHRGATCTVYVRKWDSELVNEVELESGVHIVHIEAGEYELEKEDLYGIVDLFADRVMKDLQNRKPIDIIHANYWLSGAVGHKLKHELNIPLVTTFHTLGEIKKKSGFSEPTQRLRVESEIIGCSDVMIGLFGLDEASRELSVTYTQILVGFTPVFAISMVLGTAQRAAGDAKTPLYIGLLTNIVNIILLIGLVEGRFGMPEMGVVGAALAGGLAFTFNSVLVLGLWFGKKLAVEIGKAGSMTYERLNQLVTISYPAGLESFIFQFGMLSFFWIVALYGTDAVAAYNIGVNVLMVSFTVGNGFAIAGATLTGQHLGASSENGPDKWSISICLNALTISSLRDLNQLLASDF